MVISGVHAVAKALEAGFGRELFVSNRRISTRLNWLLALGGEKGCNVIVGELPDELNESNSQGVALKIITPRYLTEKDLNAVIAEETESLVFLILDGITDPRNFGACLRSAASYGISGVIISKDNYCRLTVPPMIWMGFQGLSDNGSMLLNIASIEHDPMECEKKNIKQIEFDWNR